MNVGDAVKQTGKEHRGTLKITRVSPGGKSVICRDSIGTIYWVRKDQLRRV